jgi:hypothetical protein
MTTKIDIANRSLLSVGARTQITDFPPGDSSVEASAIAVLWQPTFEALGRAARWNALRKQDTLSLLAAAKGTPENEYGLTLPLPPQPWLYSYAYPTDCLSMQYIVPTFPDTSGSSPPPTTINNSAGTWLPGAGGQIKYVVSTSKDAQGNSNIVILCNQRLAQAVYTCNQSNPQLWDSMFQAAMVASLAAFLVPALTLSFPLMQMSIASAEKMIIQARTADGNEGVTTMDHLPDWMRARTGGTGFGLGYGGYSWEGYQDMAWPTGQE